VALLSGSRPRSARTQPRRRVPALLAIVLATLGAVAPQTAHPRAAVDDPAPDFELSDLSGGAHRLSSERGRVVLIDFWASWCAPCAAELGCLVELAGRHPQDVTLLAVTIDRDADTARTFVAKRPLGAARVLHDGDSDVMSEFGADGLPALYLVDRDGIVRDLHDGAGGCRAIAAKLDGLLQPSPSTGAPPHAP
jgi:thiol-disulfide isomerase/thioredoxin